jgi:tetratricopeptide (TPR) repeat protein
MKILRIIIALSFLFLVIFFVRKIFDDFYSVDHSLVESMIEEKRIDDANRYLDSKIEKYSDDGLLYYERAKVFVLKKDYNKALSDLDRSISLGFPLVSSYNLKAVIYGNMGDYKKQMELAQKAIENDPTDWEGYLIRARAYFYMNDYKKSLKDYDTAYRIENDDDILLEKADVLLKDDNPDKAIELLLSLNRKYPQNPSVMYKLFIAYKLKGYYNNALYLISELYNIKKDLFYLREKIKLLYEMGDYYYSASESYKLLTSTSSQENDYYLHSILMYKNLKFNEALEYLNILEKKYPENKKKYFELKKKILIQKRMG